MEIFDLVDFGGFGAELRVSLRGPFPLWPLARVRLSSVHCQPNSRVFLRVDFLLAVSVFRLEGLSAHLQNVQHCLHFGAVGRVLGERVRLLLSLGLLQHFLVSFYCFSFRTQCGPTQF